MSTKLVVVAGALVVILGALWGYFSALKKTLDMDADRTGLGLDNIGHLLERVGANFSARVAFENAVDAEHISQYENDLLDFLRAHFPQDTNDMQKVQLLLLGTT